MLIKTTSSKTPSIPNHLLPIGHGRYAIIDPEDYAYLSRYTWRLRKSHSKLYVVRRQVIKGKRSIVFLHRQLLSASADEEVHHRNGNTLDNRKMNLQLLTAFEHHQIHNLDRITKAAPIVLEDLRLAHR